MRPILHKPKYSPYRFIEPSSDNSLADKFLYFVPPEQARGGSETKNSAKDTGASRTDTERASMIQQVKDWLRQGKDNKSILQTVSERENIRLRKFSKDWTGVRKRGRPWISLTQEAKDWYQNAEHRADVDTRMGPPRRGESRRQHFKRLTAAIQASQQDAMISRYQDLKDTQTSGEYQRNLQQQRNAAAIEKGRKLSRKQDAEIRRDTLISTADKLPQQRAAEKQTREALLNTIYKDQNPAVQQAVQEAIRDITENGIPPEDVQRNLIEQYHTIKGAAEKQRRADVPTNPNLHDRYATKFNKLRLLQGLSPEEAREGAIDAVLAEEDEKARRTKEAQERQNIEDRAILNLPESREKIKTYLDKVAGGSMPTAEQIQTAESHVLREFRTSQEAKMAKYQAEAITSGAYLDAFLDLKTAQPNLDGATLEKKAMQKAIEVIKTKEAEAAKTASAETAPSAEDVKKQREAVLISLGITDAKQRDSLLADMNADPATAQAVLAEIAAAQQFVEDASKRNPDVTLTDDQKRGMIKNALDTARTFPGLDKSKSVLVTFLQKIIGAMPSIVSDKGTPEPVPAPTS